MSDYFIGMSVTGHDPSIAIMSGLGECLFAEATERYLQSKRAIGSPADIEQHITPILSRIIESDPEARFYLAQSWLNSSAQEKKQTNKELLLDIKSVNRIADVHKSTQQSSGAALRYLLGDRLKSSAIEGFDHHHCHAVSAYFFSPYENALCVVIDGEGETGAISVFSCEAGKVKRLYRNWGAASLGGYFAWITELCGFSSLAGEEWKVMGLAAFAKPDAALVKKLSSLFVVKNGRLYLCNEADILSTKQELETYRRFPQQTPDYMASAVLAASAQEAYKNVLDMLIASIIERVEFSAQNLILTGGCALNSAYNGEFIRRQSHLNVHIPPAPGDDGNSIGAALLLRQKVNGPNTTFPFGWYSPYLGSQVDSTNLVKLQTTTGSVKTEFIEESKQFEVLAELLQNNAIIGIMRGRAEFGPRALGNRSIIASPTSPKMKDLINKKVKGREAYRPFAPVIAEERCYDWFTVDIKSPYMSSAIPIRNHLQKKIPAVTHANGTGRVQTINKSKQFWLYQLLASFENKSGCPVLLNTSFNIMGKPIIHTVEDAIATFMTTELDALLIENLLLIKQ